MKQKKNNNNETGKESLKLIGLFALITMVLVTLLIPRSPEFLQGLFSGETIQERDVTCKNLTIKTIPTPLLENQQAIVSIETEPASFKGPFTVSSSTGSLMVAGQEEGSYFTTSEKVLSYSGGEEGSRITIQALGEDNANCFDVVILQDKEHINCETLTVSTYPAPVPPNESIDLSIAITPDSWQGTFLVRADSGKFQLTGADEAAEGMNTNTLITSLRKIIYTGGKDGESITISALGEGNEACRAEIAIETPESAT